MQRGEVHALWIMIATGARPLVFGNVVLATPCGPRPYEKTTLYQRRFVTFSIILIPLDPSSN
jgi:hypothetical protein